MAPLPFADDNDDDDDLSFMTSLFNVLVPSVVSAGFVALAAPESSRDDLSEMSLTDAVLVVAVTLAVMSVTVERCERRS